MLKDKSKSKQNDFLAAFRDKKYDLLFNIIAMIIGIFLALQLEGWRRQIFLNRDTKVKLHIMFLESEYNLKIGNRLYDGSIDTTKPRIRFKKLDDLAARTAFEDKNIFRILQPYKITLIRTYIDAIQTLNRNNEIYINYLESIGYNYNSKAEILLKSVNKNSLAFLSVCVVLQQEFKLYFNKEKYDNKKIREMEFKIKAVMEQILEDKLKNKDMKEYAY